MLLSIEELLCSLQNWKVKDKVEVDGFEMSVVHFILFGKGKSIKFGTERKFT